MSKICYIEVRGAAGGDEAKIWASDLLRMYLRYAAKKGWEALQLDEATAKITGENAFTLLKSESGIHRVQRVPITEKRGRIHTSTAAVVVLPQITDHQIHINPADLDWQFFRSGGHGGQNVNKVSTAVRLTHRPTGIVVTTSEERFQQRNREIALDLLRSKLWEREETKKQAEITGYRSAGASGERSDKIKTYNFPQNRVTDHRLGKKWHNLEAILEGDLDKITEATAVLP